VAYVALSYGGGTWGLLYFIFHTVLLGVTLLLLVTLFHSGTNKFPGSYFVTFGYFVFIRETACIKGSIHFPEGSLLYSLLYTSVAHPPTALVYLLDCVYQDLATLEGGLFCHPFSVTSFL
jgi:hypothetical protein